MPGATHNIAPEQRGLWWAEWAQVAVVMDRRTILATMNGRAGQPALWARFLPQSIAREQPTRGLPVRRVYGGVGLESGCREGGMVGRF
jgi:hypothetical protein